MSILTTKPDGPECPLSPFVPGGPCSKEVSVKLQPPGTLYVFIEGNGMEDMVLISILFV
jgi:hypothetical protein